MSFKEFFHLYGILPVVPEMNGGHSWFRTQKSSREKWNIQRPKNSPNPRSASDYIQTRGGKTLFPLTVLAVTWVDPFQEQRRGYQRSFLGPSELKLHKPPVHTHIT